MVHVNITLKRLKLNKSGGIAYDRARMGKVHLGSIVEYNTTNWARLLFGGLIYGGYQDSYRTEVLGIRADKKICCKLDGKKKPRWYNINGFRLIEEE